MSPQQTRQLGIEFERRVQTMIPEKEYLDKLDSQTIYSYLNQYQDKYIHDIYRNLDNIQSGSKVSLHIESILQSMLKEDSFSVENAVDNTQEVQDNNGIVVSTGRSVTFTLKDDFYLYVRSTSKVSSTYSFKSTSSDGLGRIRIIPNQFVSLNDVWKLVETPNNSLRILRNPAAVLSVNNNSKPTLTVIYDQYTTPEAVSITYYKLPQHFDVLTSTPCELPMDAFDDLVSGAVDLYVQYVAGAEARKKLMQEQQRQRAREDERDANRSRREQ